MRKLPILIFIAVAIAFGAMLTQKSEPGKKAEATGSGTAFPTLTLTATDGVTQWDQQKLQGHVTVITFFASWCAPCADEMPQLAALKQQYPNITFEGVAWNDDPDTLKKWLETNGNPFSTVWFDKNGDATIELGIKGIPETFVIDDKGIIRYRLPAPITPDLREGEFAMLLSALQNNAQLKNQVLHGL